KEAEVAQAVIEGHHHRALLRECRAIVHRLRSRAGVVTAAVDPEHDRTLLGGALRGSPDVEIETVLAHLLVAALHTDWAELSGLAGSFPVRGGLRGAPAEIADGRRRIRNALEDTHLRGGGGSPGNRSRV